MSVGNVKVEKRVMYKRGPGRYKLHIIRNRILNEKVQKIMKINSLKDLELQLSRKSGTEMLIKILLSQ